MRLLPLSQFADHEFAMAVFAAPLRHAESIVLAMCSCTFRSFRLATFAGTWRMQAIGAIIFLIVVRGQRWWEDWLRFTKPTCWVHALFASHSIVAPLCIEQFLQIDGGVLLEALGFAAQRTFVIFLHEWVLILHCSTSNALQLSSLPIKFVLRDVLVTKSIAGPLATTSTFAMQHCELLSFHTLARAFLTQHTIP